MATTKEILESYQREQITLASPEALTLMLYEAARKSVMQARTQLSGATVDVLTASQLARDIFLELADNVNLDHPHGATMRDLYLYCWRTVMTATSHPDPDQQFKVVEAVLDRLMAGLRAFMAGQSSHASESAPTSLNFVG
ncbi:MAG: flagellar biosynthesis protein FliS [Sulfobacillus acidophilus]|uniref:Flagellar biosynthesis protein FliS n=1 Tax=Sulfobacillus acidophilus TaxID=53633 RepID=A0A2T2WLA7_9FIRM|nr:MAG: flagellar biosynthesis protein FliS [Sulfobacillus acidophilus]